MPPHPEPERSAFDVLALVTSAGSGDALSVMMAGLPDVPPAALLLGRPLGADYALEELLGGQPRRPVRWAQNGTLLETGYLYVGLLQTLLEVQPDHRVNVTPLQSDGRSDGLTDRLPTFLAGSCRPGVLALVLAGEGSDHLVQMPPGTPAGFLVTQVFCEQGTEFDIPLAQRLMEEWRPHAVKRGQPRCSDQDGRPFTTMLTWMPRWCSNSWTSR